MTNHPSHDPDIEHLPFFAISPVFFSNVYSTYYKRYLPFDFASRMFVSLQHKLFYIVMLFARLNLYRLSYDYLVRAAQDTTKARGGKWAWRMEVLGVLGFWCWFGAVLYGCGSWSKALIYVLISHVTTSPLHVQVCPFLFAEHGFLTMRRSFCHISQCQRKIWDQENPSFIDNLEQLAMSYALHTLISFMAGCTYRLPTTCSRGYPGIT